MTTAPKDRYDLVPAPAAERAFLDAFDRGRLHHAWLLCGPEGLGKATFAYRAARRLLGARPDDTRGPLGASPNDPVSQLIAAQSHPDLLVLERLSEGGKVKKSISVDQARDLPEFFSKSPSQADYRVAIIDSADDLNPNAANALLKILEEPPERGVLLLVTHAPGRLLATIRSRCRRLTFAPWTDQAVATLIGRQTDLEPDEALRIAGMARGSPGAALALASEANLALDLLARRWVEEPGLDRAEQMAMSDTFRGGEGPARFEALMDRLSAAVKARSLGASDGAAWADLWTRLSDLPDRTAAINLDRADVLSGALADLARVKAASAR
ncbi:DNA polymerase III subunit delta' [Brevundimonas sp. LM2]|uniref:DNA polymerase III subunit delta' n=1 Tax=Brevundimonas sp. LM2 TaxID=1938605 RepID=UPI000983C8DF|nr:DNA polymerase III subunit delta' [Brevundimonas sp. LM2]AQR61920.1 DNA polymerase III subunit delta' [Brevundimonas sp. LM2]